MTGASNIRRQEAKEEVVEGKGYVDKGTIAGRFES